MSDHDTRYYRERAITERALALASARQDVREVHEELARQYDALAKHAQLRPTTGIHLPPGEVQPASV